MDYWTSFLKKRADEDLGMYDTFEISTNLGDKYLYIKIKDGNITLKNEKNVNDRRDNIVKYFISKMNTKNIPDCEIPIYIADSYGWQDKHIHFCWSKPQGKKGILFPSWEFKNWENVKQNFTDEYIPWTERERGPYFIGKNSTKQHTNLRKIIQELYPEHVRILEEKDTYREPPTNLMKYKLAFNLPGYKPWSIRSALIDLAGCSQVAIYQYYSKWKEGPWYQFFEDPNTFDGVFLEGNYNTSFPNKKIPLLKTELDNEIDKAIKRHAKAKANRERMMKLTTDHIVSYLEYIFTEVGKKQNN